MWTVTLVVYQNARWEGSRSRPRGYEHTERSSLAALRHAWRKGLDRFTEQLTRFQRPSSWILLLGLSALILDYRCHGYFVNPDLRAEDGKMVYAFFFQSRDLREVLRFKAGYMPLVPNALGYVAARLPPSAVPYFLALVPASFAAAVFVVFNAASFRRYVPSDRLRLCCCVGLALAPLANFFLVCNTDYSIWNLLVLLLWLVLVRMPDSKLLALPFTVLLTVLVWTHPTSIVALPATICWLWVDKRPFSRLLHALVSGAQVLHVFYGATPHSASVFFKGDSVSEQVWVSLAKFFGLLLHALSSALFPYLPADSVTLARMCPIVLLVALAVCAVLPKKSLAERAFFVWLLYCIVVPLFAVVLVRPTGLSNPRYLYSTRVFGAVGIGLVIGRALAFCVARFPRFRRLLWFVPELSVLVYFVSLNRPGVNAAYAQPDPRNGKIIHDCLAELARLQRERGSPCGLRVQCRKRHGDWPFTIDTPLGCDE